jgi:Glycosyltransferase family 87
MGAVAAAAGILLAFWPTDVADYARDAGPSLHPLINGDFTAAFAHQPAMGWFAILLRAPFAFFARHGSALLEYRLGNVPCVLVLVALAVWLASRTRSRGTAVVVLALAVLGPMNWHALADGHPEELLGAALCVAAVLAAGGGRSPLGAGVLLGLALASKQWAILAAGPALLAAPSGRARLAAAATGVGGILTLLPVLAGSHHVLSPASSVAFSSAAVQPATIWWPFAHSVHVAAPGWSVDHRVIPMWIANLAHPGIVILGLVLPVLGLRRTKARVATTETALALLSLLFLFRGLLDPMNVGYYQVPLLVSLVALEALHRRGIPVLSLVSNAVMWVLVARIPWGLEPGKVAALYLAWALPLAVYLGLKVYAPSVISALGKWLSTSLPSSVTTTRSSIRTPNAPGT